MFREHFRFQKGSPQKQNSKELKKTEFPDTQLLTDRFTQQGYGHKVRVRRSETEQRNDRA